LIDPAVAIDQQIAARSGKKFGILREDMSSSYKYNRIDELSLKTL